MALTRRCFGALTTASAFLPAIGAAAEPGGILTVATVGEPPTLDPMASTADLVGMITQHIFETLYTFDKNWAVTPLLAAALPDVSADGRTVTINLRTGVTFHDGSAMSSADVLASLRRWATLATRGRQTAPQIAGIEAPDAATIRITLKQPYAPLPALLAFNNSAAIIIPAVNIASPLTAIIGTGPYKLRERKPDQYIQLVRFDAYASPPGAPDGYGGGRHPLLDEIRFIPVPDAATRVASAAAGQYHYADSLPVEAFDRFKGSVPIVLKPFGWPQIVMNTKQGMFTSLALRRAVQTALSPEDMLAAAFGSKEFYAVDGALYPPGYVWNTGAGVARYGDADPEAAAKLVKQAGYDGRPLRLLTSRQYEFHYKMAQVAEAYLKQAGFKLDLQVTDWATLTQRRAEPALWDIFITHSPFLPEPALTGFMADDSPGWWSTPQKDAAVSAFNRETDPAKRVQLWAQVQTLFYQEAPAFKVGDFNTLSARSTKLAGFVPAPWPYFWNASLTA